MFGPENRAALFLRERVLRQEAAPARAFPGAIQSEGEKFPAVKLGIAGLAGRYGANQQAGFVDVFGDVARLPTVKLRRRNA